MYSGYQVITAGIPQGSLLGVVLFQLHIDSIKECLCHTSSILYADDTTIYVYGKNHKALKAKMQSDLNSFSMWLCVNKLLLNVKKNKSMLFSRYPSPEIDLHVNDQSRENVKCFKFLGYYLDSKLNFEHHVFNLKRQLTSIIVLIQRLSVVIPYSCLRLLYFAHFFSRISYRLNIWFPLLNEVEREKLNVLHK